MEDKLLSGEAREEEVLEQEASEGLAIEDVEELTGEAEEEIEAAGKKKAGKKGGKKGGLIAVLLVVLLGLIAAALYLSGTLNGLLNLNITYSGAHAGLLAGEILEDLTEQGKRYGVKEQAEVPKNCVKYILPHLDGEYIAIPNKVIELNNGDTLFVDQIIWDRFEMTAVKLDPEELRLMEGETGKMSASIIPGDSFDTDLKWASSNEAVATVDESGNITAVGYGDAEITATGNNGTVGKAKVHVDIWPKGMSITSEMGVAYEGDTQTLILTIQPDYAVLEGIEWKSGDTAIATVEEGGVVTGVKGGKVKITATAPNGTTASYEMEVQVEPTAVTLSETSLQQGRGDEIALTAAVVPAEADQDAILWESSNPDVATVTQEGLVNIVGLGEVSITATAPNGVQGKCDILSDIQFEKAEITKVSGSYKHGTGNYNITVRTNGCVTKVEFYNTGLGNKVATKYDEDMSQPEKTWHFSYPTWAHGGYFHFRVVAYSEAGTDSYKWTYKSEISGH